MGAATPIYKGDPGVEIKSFKAIAAGSSANVSQVAFGVHSATHVDAPNHFIDGARRVHEIDPKVPRSLSKIVERCLEPLCDFRYQTATEVLTHLDAWLAPAWRKAGKWIAAAAAVLLLVGTQILVQRTHKTPTQHAPVSVLVADFKNDTGDAVFEGTLEPAFGTALEGASFVSSYSRAEAHRVAAQLQPGATMLDESLARLVATREGIHNVVTGSIRKQGDRYEVQVRTVDPFTGKVLVSSESGSEKKDVLVVVAKLAARVRKALGDAVPESVQLAQAETFTTRSLEAAHEYARAMNLEIAGKYDDAIIIYASGTTGKVRVAVSLPSANRNS